ncbi:hypothetical protein OROHE_017351 [Orobanche hederae]
MMSFEMNDRKKIGLGLTGFGIFFSILGIIFFFDKGLLAMGNILFLSGVTLTIGLKSSMQFFMKRSNYKGSISFGIGFFLVIIGWPIIGMILEAYGFVVLFSGFWPTLAVFLQKIPVLGLLFQQPFIRSALQFQIAFAIRYSYRYSRKGLCRYGALFAINNYALKLRFFDRYRGKRVPV